MSETIAITGKSVKLFKGHYSSLPLLCYFSGKRGTKPASPFVERV
ncbi:MAG: hypothetical protein ACREYE_08350 [Gammaproteobacteria bacterium]